MSGVAWGVCTALAWLITSAAPRFGAGSHLVNAALAVTLVFTYLALWRMLGAWSTDTRQTFKAITVTIVGVAGLALLESSAVFGWVDYRILRTSLIGAEGPNEFVDDPVLSFRRPPHVRWHGWPLTDMAVAFNLPVRVDHPMTFTTDANGFRNPTDRSRATIALVGDSYVEGWTLSDEETIAARLADRTGVPVENLGTAGYGSLQELRVLTRYALPMQPKLIAWFFFEGNDLDDDQNFENAMTKVERAAAARPAPAPSAARWWRDFVDRSFTWNAFLELRRRLDAVVPNAIDTYGWFRDGRGVTDKLYFYDFYATRELGDYERSRLRVTEATLREAAEECRRHGVAFTVFYVPIKFRVYGDLVRFPAGSRLLTWHAWDLESAFGEMCARLGIRFVSLTGPMHEAARAGALLYEAADSHWNAAGAEFVADRVADVFRSLASTTDGRE